LGSVLNNAKDWEGHRLMRQRKSDITDEKWEEYIVVDDVHE